MENFSIMRAHQFLGEGVTKKQYIQEELPIKGAWKKEE